MNYNRFSLHIRYKGDDKMKETLEKLWLDYLMDECAEMDTAGGLLLCLVDISLV